MQLKQEEKRMIRQKQRKHIEELYGTKLDVPKSHVIATHQNGDQKLGSATERGYNNISSTAPCKVIATPACAAVGSAASKSLNCGKETSRRKSARPSNKIPNEKHYIKETFVMKDGRRSPAQATKDEKLAYTSPLNAYDNKNYGNNKEILVEHQKHRQHHHQHNHHNHQNHHHNSHDEDKDDGTDEFFDLIRRTVEGAIGKSISELLNRNFKELSLKVDRFSADLKNTNAVLYQMQKELNNKIGHYGEESSRHFRYLCMKSEYDKMFYQHQTMIAAAKPPIGETSPETLNTSRRKSFPKTSKGEIKIQLKEGEKNNSAAVACPYHSKNCKQRVSEIKEPQQSSSGDILQKSSEVGIREVLDHIQKFCTHIQFNDYKCEQSSDGPGTSQQRNVMRHADMIKMNKEAFAEDDEADEEDDIWEISSDDMTPRNKANDSHEYGGGNTTRGDTTQRGNNGAGDG